MVVAGPNINRVFVQSELYSGGLFAYIYLDLDVTLSFFYRGILDSDMEFLILFVYV